MANEVLANEALAPPPDGAPSEDEYRAFCAALEASARGRAFLAEYARRNRHADTETVLAALDRLATLVRSQATTAEAERIRQELRALLSAMRSAQPAIDASAAAIKAAKLAALIGFVQHRIESIVAPARAHSALPAEVAALVMAGDAAVDAARAHLAVVPRADEPELPIPAPAAAPAPTIALVEERAQPETPAPVVETPRPVAHVIEAAPPRRAAAIMPEVNLFDRAPVKPVVVEPAPPEQTLFAPTDTPLIPAHSPPRSQSGFALAEQGAGIQESNRVSDDVGPGSPLPRGRAANPTQIETALAAEIAATPPPAFELTLSPPAVQPKALEPQPADDPLALIMALSEAERIALFT